MWVLIAREPKPDASYWSGRRLLAVIDALLWPLLWVLAIRSAPGPVGLMGPFAMAVAVLCAAGRLHRAVWVNHRYWFTTWRWGRLAAALLCIGAMLKLAMPA